MFIDAFDNNNFKFKFKLEKGDFVKAPSPAPILQINKPTDTMRTAYVFVIRRDAASNISVYDNSGSLVAVAPANTEGYQRTDGDIVFDHIGNGGFDEKFQGNVARLGIIAKT